MFYLWTVCMPTVRSVFGKTQVAYLRHVISGEDVVADPSKIQVMVSWPTPINLKELWGFLGLTSYYGKFVEGYVWIVLALIEQLKKDKFGWNMELDFTKSFIIETDASGFGLGVVLLWG